MRPPWDSLCGFNTKDSSDCLYKTTLLELDQELTIELYGKENEYLDYLG
jgi:hypothetical protein